MRHSPAELWDPAPSSVFMADALPERLKRIIPPWAPKVGAVRLRMRGEIRLKRWKAFDAEEVIDHARGFVWKARVAGALSGFDALVDGRASARWNWLGVIPVMRATGPDVTRSAIGRWLLESIWLPTMWRPDDGAAWEGSKVTLTRFGETGSLHMGFTERGGLRDFRMMRWGNPDGGPCRYHLFGGVVEEERRFGGFLLPSRVRVGWHFGTPAWKEGEFFRATIQEASFR
jgi:uncharacterized protein DUF6544